MIRNNYLLSYNTSNNSSIIPDGSKFVSGGENYNLYLERPLELSSIQKIKENKIYKFIDNIMVDKTINHLLYSSNARKVATFYLKQKKFLLKQHLPLQIEDDNLFRKKKISFTEKLKREKIMEDINDYIKKFRKDRNRYLTQMMEKNDEFLNSQPDIDKKLEKLEWKNINKIRLDAYKKAFNKCLNLSMSKIDFEMPDLSNKDVFGRLYNNNPLRLNYKEKKSNSADKIISSKQTSLKKNSAKIFKKYKLLKKKSQSDSMEYDVNQHYKKKILKFKLNSNLTRNEHNMKQFNINISKQMIKRCWSTISGGPSNKREEKIKKEKIKEKFKNKFNYKILSNKKKGDIKDLSLYNTMIVDDPFLRKCKIKNSNYRDSKNNSSLHIAVNNDSIKMVKYLLSKKKKNINAKNKKGQTALHIACLKEEDDIIDLLVKNGANINAVDFQGKKPFDLLSPERDKY